MTSSWLPRSARFISQAPRFPPDRQSPERYRDILHLSEASNPILTLDCGYSSWIAGSGRISHGGSVYVTCPFDRRHAAGRTGIPMTIRGICGSGLLRARKYLQPRLHGAEAGGGVPRLPVENELGPLKPWSTHSVTLAQSDLRLATRDHKNFSLPIADHSSTTACVAQI